MVEKTVDIDEAQRELRRMVGEVSDQGDRYVLERGGEPQAVMLSFAAYRRMQELEEQIRRQEALNGLRLVKARVSPRNQDLGKADALAHAFHIVAESMPASGEPILTCSRDRKDNDLVAQAVSARADFLVSGDDDLLSLVEGDGVKIVSPADFVQMLEGMGLA